MNAQDFDQEMKDLGVRLTQLEEVRTAKAQTEDGFTLILARAKGALNPPAALISLIREGAHLRAAPARKAHEKTGGFVCNFCGSLPAANAENHYANFPEHQQGKPVVLVYPDPPSRRP